MLVSTSKRDEEEAVAAVALVEKAEAAAAEKVAAEKAAADKAAAEKAKLKSSRKRASMEDPDQVRRCRGEASPVGSRSWYTVGSRCTLLRENSKYMPMQFSPLFFLCA